MTAPDVHDATRAAADAEVAAGRIGFAPADDIPGAAADAALSVDGRWRLETTPVRTRKIDVATGEATIALEGWLQVAPAWLPDGRFCVLCTEGDGDLDLADPEIGSLRTLREGYPGPDRVVRVQSSGLLHVLGADGSYLHHVKVDADRIDAVPARGLVVLTRARPKKRARWGTAILLATPAGLVVLAKHAADIGRLVVSGERVYGSHGFELLGLDAAIAAVNAVTPAWRTVAIEDGLAVEPPPPPPPSSISLAPTTTLTLVRVDATRPSAPASTDAATDEPSYRTWAPVISVARADAVTWELLRLHQALCEVVRVERRDGAWAATAHLPVTGFDRVYTADGGRLVAVSIDNAPPEMAWSMLVADDGGVLRNLGGLHHVITALWDADDGVHVELFGGHVYRVDGLAEAIAAARTTEPRPLQALVFDVPGHYGYREFLPRHDGDVGFIDRSGAPAIAHHYTRAYDFDAAAARVAHCGPRLFGLVDPDGRLVVPHHYSWIGELRGGCRRVGRGEPDICGDPPKQALWGLLGDDGAVVLAPEAISVRDMADGRAAVERAPGRWNLVTRDGAMLLEADADGCGSFGDGLCPVRRGDRWGYVDRDGRWVIEPRFARATDFAGGLAAVTEPDASRWRLLARDGTFVGDGHYDEVAARRDPLVRVAVDGRWGFVAHDGAEVIAPRFDQAFDFHDERASVRVGGAWTWIDPTGALLTEPCFARAFDFSGGVGLFQRGALYGFLSAGGDVLAEGFEGAGALVEDRAAFCQRARWGFLDHMGAIVIRPRYARVLGFSEGLAAVRSAGAWGFIDATGAQVIPPTLGDCGSFHHGRARVTARR